jgi:hypothetical protein
METPCNGVPRGVGREMGRTPQARRAAARRAAVGCLAHSIRLLDHARGAHFAATATIAASLFGGLICVEDVARWERTYRMRWAPRFAIRWRRLEGDAPAAFAMRQGL